MFCQKEKAIYAALNLFEGDITLRADCWYPAAEEDQIRSMLIQQSNAQQASAMLVTDRSGVKRNPPTFIRKNEFTGPTQDLIDTYGVAKYQEANLWTSLPVTPVLPLSRRNQFNGAVKVCAVCM